MTNAKLITYRCINFAPVAHSAPQQPVREIMGSWKKLNDDLLESESFGKLIKTSGFLKRQVDEVTAGITEPEKKWRPFTAM